MRVLNALLKNHIIIKFPFLQDPTCYCTFLHHSTSVKGKAHALKRKYTIWKPIRNSYLSDQPNNYLRILVQGFPWICVDEGPAHVSLPPTEKICASWATALVWLLTPEHLTTDWREHSHDKVNQQLVHLWEDFGLSAPPQGEYKSLWSESLTVREMICQVSQVVKRAASLRWA